MDVEEERFGLQFARFNRVTAMKTKMGKRKYLWKTKSREFKYS